MRHAQRQSGLLCMTSTSRPLVLSDQRDNSSRPLPAGCLGQVWGKWLMAQPTREQEVVYFATMVAPRTGPDVAIDVSQALNRLRGLDQEQGSNGHLSTFTTSTKLWLVRARRVISGRERLAMHGLSLRSWTKHASDSLLGDMAGNSFHAMAFIIALIASCRP